MNNLVPVYVLDSYALLAHLEDESAKGEVVRLMEQANQGSNRLLLSVINLGEALYITERERGQESACKILAVMDQLPVEILPADREAVLAAAHLKAHHRMSYADAFAAAAAQSHRAILVTGDPEFRSVETIIQVKWLP